MATEDYFWGKLKNISKFPACFGIIFFFAFAALSAEASSRAAQKRSQGDVRTLAVAVQCYSVDWDSYPDTGGKVIPFQEINSLPTIKNKIVPDYLREFVPKDGWQKGPYYYVSNGKHFVIYCLGSDGRADKDLDVIIKQHLDDGKLEYTKTGCYENDIVWGDDAFIRAPEGPQKHCK